MSNSIKLISIISFVCAVVAWGGVVYSAQMIRGTAVERSNDTKEALTKANQAALNQRVETLALNTKEKRDQLKSLAGTDVVAIVDIIDAAGKSAGITAKVSDAAVGGTTALGKSGDTLRAVVFNVQGEGTFTQVMHAASMYEKLPLLSSIDQMDIEKVQAGDPKSTLWHINVRIRVQTLITI